MPVLLLLFDKHDNDGDDYGSNVMKKNHNCQNLQN